MAKNKAKEAKEVGIPVTDLFKGGTLTPVERIASTHTQELVIALCGPIGSPVHAVGAALKQMLEESFDYEPVPIIRLSRFIEKTADVAQADQCARNEPGAKRHRA